MIVLFVFPFVSKTKKVNTAKANKKSSVKNFFLRLVIVSIISKIKIN